MVRRSRLARSRLPPRGPSAAASPRAEAILEFAVGGGGLLNPVERSAEVLFGLIMAVTILGSLSIARAGSNEVRTATAAALGCNIAWGLVDAVMYLVRTLTERARVRHLARHVVAADVATAHHLIRHALPADILTITGQDELEGMRRRLLTHQIPDGRVLGPRDYLAALGVFALVVLATFPVALPFLLTDDYAVGMRISGAITLVMLFAAGVVLGLYAGYRRPGLTGGLMVLLGAGLIAAVKLFGG
jgi:VIT1/CCC1 family predicted Fe2+/Mn2+ transporter